MLDFSIKSRPPRARGKDEGEGLHRGGRRYLRVPHQEEGLDRAALSDRLKPIDVGLIDSSRIRLKQSISTVDGHNTTFSFDFRY